MMCRQVLPDTNGIEQIYIVKSEPGTTDGNEGGSGLMAPEDVDQIKEEPESAEEDEGAPVAPEVASAVVKIEHEEAKAEADFSDADSSSEGDVDLDFLEKFESNAESNREVDKVEPMSFSEEDEPIHLTVPESAKQDPAPIKQAKKRGPNKKKSDKPPKEKKASAEKPKRFVCNYCTNKFSTLYILKRHEKTHNIPEDKQAPKLKNMCYICQKGETTNDELQKHLCTHVDLLPYTCNDCESPHQVVSVRMLNKHFQMRQDTKSGIIKCIYCDATFHSLSACRQHESSHIKQGDQVEESIEEESKRLNVKIVMVDGLKRYECEYCDKTYNHYATLRRHANVHTMEKEYNCKICFKKFTKASSLTIHARTHSEYAPYKCETCGKAFRETMRLIEHRRVHTGEKPFACHCGLTFRKNNALKEHKKACDIPEVTPESTCRFCQKTFPSYPDMMSHIKQIHGHQIPDTKCQHCTMKFKNSVLLVIHEFRHQLPDVIKCGQCNHIFKHQSNLERHMNIHTNEVESFVCDMCGKIFSQAANLRIHKRIHTGERPAVCDLCPKTFYCTSTLGRHRLTHFKESGKNFIPTAREEDETEQSDEVEAAESL